MSAVEIDQYALDEEWLNQPVKMEEAGRLLADARYELDLATAKLSIIAAELDAAIRDDPQQFGLSKATDKSVEKAVLNNPRHQKQQVKVLKLKHKVGLLQSLVTALDHRKKALENLVFLHGQQYFSSPRASAEDRETIEEMDRQKTRRRGHKRK